MGMFDSIQCNCLLPLPLDVIDLNLDIYSIEFQTKDFDNILSNFFITEEGRIMEEIVESKWVDDDNAFFKGYLKPISSHITDVNFHGILEFYCYEDVQVQDSIHTLDLTYAGRFTDGTLISLEVLDYSVTDSTQYRQESRQHIKELMLKQQHPIRKYFLNTRAIVFVRRRILLKCFNSFYNFASYLRSLAIRYL